MLLLTMYSELPKVDGVEITPPVLSL